MWVLLRLLAALVVGLTKFFWRGKFKGEERKTGETTWLLHTGRHKGRVVAHEIGVRYQNSVYLRLTRESTVDRFFKAIGFTHEVQTGDGAFDLTVYVGCDHPAIAPVLQASALAREATKALFAAGFGRITCDGEYLRAYRSGSVEPGDVAAGHLAALRDELQALPVEHLRVLRDHFFWRALFVESLAWSLAFYTVPTLIEMAARPHPLYFNYSPLFRYGLFTAIGAFAFLFGMSWWFLRGSSRSHRVLTESAILLLIGVPLSSLQMVSDYNVQLDQSSAVPIERVVADKYTRITRSRRGSRTHYHLRLTDQSSQFYVPQDVEVSWGIYNRVNKGGRIISDIRAGALGIPWVQDMHPPR